MKTSCSLILTTTFTAASWLVSLHLVSASPGGKGGGKGGGSCKLDILDGVCGGIESDVVTELCVEAEGFGDKCDNFFDFVEGGFLFFDFFSKRGPIVNTFSCNRRFGGYHLQYYFAEGDSSGGLACCPACAFDLTELDDEAACIFVQDDVLAPDDCGDTIVADGFDGIAVVLNGAYIQGGQNEFYCCSFGV